jgi:hypothetical protein
MGSVGDIIGEIGGAILGPASEWAVRGLEALAALSGGEVKAPK